jgi:hypothetical protein
MYRSRPDMTELKECVACRHEIDAAARICPYCGGDPVTGRRFDSAPILQSHFPMRDTAPRARVAEFMRERQGLVVAGIIVTIVLLVGAAHQMITRRNQALESAAPAVPLTDLADLNQPTEDQKEIPLPDLEFTWTGQPETMEVLLVEPGAVAPAQPVAPTGAAGPGAQAAPGSQPPTGPAARQGQPVRPPVGPLARPPRPPAGTRPLQPAQKPPA